MKTSRLFLALALSCGLAQAALAACPNPLIFRDGQATPTQQNALSNQDGNGNCVNQAGGFSKSGVTGTLVRPANTTTYAPAAGAGVNIGQSTTAQTTAIPLQVARSNGLGGRVSGIRLMKSSNVTTNATFIVHLFNVAPTLTNIHDGVAYVGPFQADISSGAYAGSATCNTSNLTSDPAAGLWYECTMLNPNVPGIAFSPAVNSQNIYGTIEVTAAYAPGNAETFTVEVELAGQD